MFMKSFEEFSLREIMQADSRAESVFRSIGVNTMLEKEKTVKEICTNYLIHPEEVLDQIVEELYKYSYR
ncbi:hypothetical protein BC751_3516 [Cecembia calidifontis]|jgi:hypothetical protein|uniref:Uncharacterized protein n=2 Tax=Cyclobacteriaceae TaxID=563798 RepID=A0A4Q7PDQ1_9BACT|nr:hypothetical protein BC751_3516 [Cecembia calidifontis]